MVVIIDNFSTAHRSSESFKTITGKFPSIQRIILDCDFLIGFEKENIDSVIHLQGSRLLGESVEKPFEIATTTILGTLVLLDVIRQFNVKDIIIPSSSATVYGMNNVVPFKEEMYKRSKPIWLYESNA